MKLCEPALMASFLTIAFGLTPTEVSAVQIRVDFTSQVTFVQHAPVMGISPSVGDLATGFFIYDTAAIDQNGGDPGRGIYQGGAMSVTIGGTTFTNNFPSLAVVLDSGSSLNDLFVVAAGTGAGQPNILVNGSVYPGAQILFSFTEPTGGLLTDALPNPFTPTLEISQFNLVETSGNRDILFDNLISLQTSVVPEPSSFVLAALGLIGLVVWRRRKR
ncbi:MAG: PEP-CTERM sorting domain-containing protein [Pirellulales bacterium]